MVTFSAMCACASAPRIDGRSAEAFDQTYRRLVDSLSQEERLQLSLAQVVLLEPTGCLGELEASTDAPWVITHLRSLGARERDVRPCRSALHGMSYRDILGAQHR